MKGRIFWKLLWAGKILAGKTERLSISIDHTGKLGKKKVEDGSIWSFNLKDRIVSIAQYSLGKEDCTLNAREDNLGIIENMQKYAQHYKIAETLIFELTFEIILKKRRF